MALIYNNLLINGNSKKYLPFLVNLVSGRRRILNADESALISSMLPKNNISDFTAEESLLCGKLMAEKQFLDDNQRKALENHMLESNYFDAADKPRKDLIFSIQLTQNCNMRCPFCFERNYINRQVYISKEMIDAIFNFFKFCTSQYGVSSTPSSIRLTGGEPLMDQKSVSLIGYAVKKWPNSKINLFTNGVNLLKYYEQLPIRRLEVDISLDGLESTHIRKRQLNVPDGSAVYKDIIAGIKRLLKDQVTVRIKTVIDMDSCLEFPKFVAFLRSEGILGSAYLLHTAGTVIDYSNSLDIDVSFNDKHEAIKIQDYLISTCGYAFTPFIGLTTLCNIIVRAYNKPYMPRTMRCSTNFPTNYYFSPNGKIYFCDCIDENKGVIGTYYPEISLDEYAIEKLASRSVINNAKCRECPYKFVCLGNCPLAALAKGEEMSCGVFADTEMLDNLEYPYYELIAHTRAQTKTV